MLYSQMSDDQRRQLLDDREMYPWRVTFLGKTGILSYEAISLLRDSGVDFDVDDHQIAEMLEEMMEKGEMPAPPRGMLLGLAAAVLAGVMLLRRVIRLSLKND